MAEALITHSPPILYYSQHPIQETEHPKWNTVADAILNIIGYNKGKHTKNVMSRLQYLKKNAMSRLQNTVLPS